MKVTCTGCGQDNEVPASAPLTSNFQFHCKSCLSPRRKRLKYQPNVEAQRILKTVLERFVGLPLHEHETEWFQLCDDLGIDTVAVEQLVLVVQEGKWRNSTALMWFLKTKVRRRFVDDADMLGLFAEDDEVTVATAGNLAADRSGMHVEWDPGWQSSEKRKQKAWTHISELLGKPTRNDWRAMNPLLTQYWDKEEVEVIKARASDVSRDRYLDSAANQKERLERQAAWRRVDRKGLPDGLRGELLQASESRLASPDWEARAARDASLENAEDVNEFDPRSSYGVGGGRRTNVGPQE